uniref:E3 ubiquitin-protein ligase n=1 Tax=Aureoumbra lagunensis TaxID=44058 RepID=A0A7S3JTU1_9STRA|mmetsp:Transcript_7633/g.11471  ORF Transcript_7633/g.11471 Transcript_7633/m.11471 type:complete len:1884 (-) Transcript_7633:131-5782(-)|eukprot:CAMPEP_0197308162 /NCGR_PEP_ID=MMETSP0891-20130614/6405_1 /TAXON_ID=44058 ORGANISM="Aureoumbra lagunensis, Strain CCMP1510" /NCGR_SAMPLE_ID=MMETSP0891 /ASSEMBLY_ACC=CAM_ASM_000534 /LENGTH=1883 /DNA_ID=CAMNT_0042792303 /DNA_START=32 /DNA_END=5683 /DNA_ORIENTATION=+
MIRVGDEVVLQFDEEESSVIEAVNGEPKKLVKLCKKDLTAIGEAARYVFRARKECDDKTVFMFAIHLLFAASNEDSPINALAKLKENAKRSSCGHVFRAGEIAWNCRECQQDTTSVLCDACFKHSTHYRENHDVYFHRASAGGVCDCGDEEAWTAHARCSMHSSFEDVTKERNLPKSLVAAPIVLRAAFEIASEVSYLSALDHDIQNSSSTQIRLYNDEIHTRDDVRDALLAAGLETHNVRRLISTVESRGEAIVISTTTNDGLSSPAESARRKLAILREKGLIASAVGKYTLRAEQRSRRASEWLSSILTVSDELRRCAAHAVIKSPVCVNSSLPTQLNFYGVSLRLDNDQRILQVGIDQVPNDEQQVESNQIWLQTLANPLAIMIACDPLCSRAVRHAKHELLLRLVVDLVAREAVRDALLACYRYLNRLFANGVGFLEDTIFALSVQVFTTPSLVRSSVDALPECILESLLETLKLAAAEADHERLRRVDIEASDLDSWLDGNIVRNRRYGHAVRDLEYILHTEDVAAAFLAAQGTNIGGVVAPSSKALESWLEVLARLECMDPQLRRADNMAHVEYMSNRWLFAFNFSLNVASASEIAIRRCLDPPDTTYKRAAIIHHGLPAVCAALLKFHTSRMLHDPNTKEESEEDVLRKTRNSQHWRLRSDGLGLNFDVTLLPVSLHLPLTRFLVLLALRISDEDDEDSLEILFPSAKAWSSPLTSLINSARLLLSINEQSNESNEDIVRRALGIALMEPALRALAYCAHVSAGMWSRNGPIAMSSCFYYSSPPSCHSLRDIDLAAVQIAATVLPPDAIIQGILRAFCVSLENDDTRFDQNVRGTLLASAIECVCILVTEMPGPQKAAEASVRRELIHALAVGPRRHSELVTIVSALSNSRGLRWPIAPLLEVIAFRQNELWELKQEVGIREYDPCFPRLQRPAHQKALDRLASWRKEQKLPVVPPPPAARTIFAATRSRLLCCATTHRLLLAGLTTSLPVLEVRSRAIHLATLLAYENQCSDQVLASLRAAKDHDLGKLYNQGLDWLLSTFGEDIESKKIKTSVEISALPSKQKKCDTARRKVIEQMTKRQEKFAATLEAEEIKSSPILAPSITKQKKCDTVRRRVMEQMAKRQANFAATLKTEDEKSSLEGPSLPVVAPSSTEDDDMNISCIVCSSSNANETLCFIGFAQRSVHLSRSIERGMRQARRRARLYRTSVDEKNMISRLYTSAKAAAKEKKDDELVGVVHGGDTILVRSVVAGSALLEKGWLPGRFLGQRPIEDDFRAWGTTHINLSSCGHAIHPSCFDSYFGALLGRELSVEMLEGRVANLARQQFLCPLCRGLSNCLIPDVKKVDFDLATDDETSHDFILKEPWTGLGSYSFSEEEVDAVKIELDNEAWSTAETEAWSTLKEDDEPPRTSEPSWDKQSYWGRRFSTSLCDVSDDQSDSAASRLAELRITWDVAAYGATCVGLQHKPDANLDSQQLYPSAATSRKQSEHGTRLICRALRYFPCALLEKEDDNILKLADIRARLSALLAGRIFETESTNVYHMRGIVRGFDIDASTWRCDGEQRALSALLTPLLDWDLSVFLCALVALWPRTLLARALNILAVAKLAQLLEGEDVASLNTEQREVLHNEYLRFSRIAAFVLEAHAPNLTLPKIDSAIAALPIFSPAWYRHRHLSEYALPIYRPLHDTEVQMKVPVLVIPGVAQASDDDHIITPQDNIRCEFSRLVRLPSSINVRFVRLPESFTELYTSLVTKHHDNDDEGPAICLLCGTVVDATRRTRIGEGPCTRHAKTHTDSVGIFFLVLKCATLITFESKAAYARSLYLDNFGEEDHNLRRGAPLQLSHDRLNALEDLHNSHGIAQEVACRRNSSINVIRDGFY